MDSGMINRLSNRIAAHQILALLLTICSFSVLALQPTPQQLVQFKSMSPAEQSRLANQLGVTLPQSSVNTSASTVVRETTVSPRDVTQDADPEVKLQDSQSEENKLPKKIITTLKPFGYDLFAGKSTSFTPINDIPVSSDYVLGPGDSLKVNLYGKESQSYELAIDQEGMVYLPDLGPLSLAGLSFSEAKQQLINTIDQKMIGVKASVSMGRLRSIRVFVLGEAHLPGSYVVSSLSTITNALVLSGGITTNGSLRTIQLKRRGKLIQALDLYDLLLKGDTSNDAQLKSGDVVFIPPVGVTVGIRGEVRRPALYEVNKGTTAKQLIKLSGGLLSTAHPELSKVQRISSDDQQLLLDVDLAQKKNEFKLNNGDRVFIPETLGLLNNVVAISGEVLRSGMQTWQKGLRISDVIAVAGLTPSADVNYALLKRYLADGRVDISSFQLSDIALNVGGLKDFTLQPLDEIIVFSWLGEGRQQQLKTIVEQLRSQTEAGVLSSEISVEGSVRFAGAYPLTKNMLLSNALLLAGVEPETDQNYGLLVRKSLNQQLDIISFQPSNVLAQEESAKNMVLQPLDRIILFSKLEGDRQAQVKDIISSLRGQADLNTPTQEVTISGSVRFPGLYPLAENMTVRELVHAAGGLSEKAFQLKAELSRTEFNSDQVRRQYRVDLNLSETDSLTFSLKPRDVLQIKTIPEWAESEQVTLNGEVKFPGVYPIYKKDTLAILLGRAGGLTEFAYAPGAIFTRVDLKKQQAQQLKEMQDRLAEDIAKAELVAANQNSENENSEDVAEAQKLLSKLEGTTATGRLVIDMKKVLEHNSDYSIPLQSGDRFFIPAKKNSVTIIGEVQFPISQVYETELSYWDYIERSGGTTDKADEDRVYIIKASGAVKMPEGSSWFASNDNKIAPGDTIVVPLDADKLDQIVLWRDMSQIFYQIALGAAAVGSL